MRTSARQRRIHPKRSSSLRLACRAKVRPPLRKWLTTVAAMPTGGVSPSGIKAKEISSSVTAASRLGLRKRSSPLGTTSLSRPKLNSSGSHSSEGLSRPSILFREVESYVSARMSKLRGGIEGRNPRRPLSAVCPPESDGRAGGWPRSCRWTAERASSPTTTASLAATAASHPAATARRRFGNCIASTKQG